MTARVLPALTCAVGLTVAACNRPAAPAPAAAPAVPTVTPAASPGCGVESVREIKLDDRTELRVWNLTATGLKRLTARLLIATDGTLQTANEIEYKWTEWGPSVPPATGQLVLLVQDGKAFGAANRRLPQLALDIQGSPSHSRTGKKQNLMLEGELYPRMTQTSHTSSLSEKNLLYVQLFLPKPDADGSFSISSDPESLAASSQGGKTVLAVALDWSSK